ncbi:N-acetylmuramoyl-L-alanine amidase [Sporotomaculum syntrophicum]|uniref:N-acetylmuramoyl-L-alanine amidase n=1 Tax=Sporotomaculum syntrophicum TaxID=182264 RepID=A0A9D3AWP8_9FIRM|nr:N-acetylmuramoyl-L-alanine amidase [Sporotomaculum syntrophicum]KAF1085735.1 N-acetylmuramoyl-L-alanine amidase [Sporotomaculum syntrophicum]
MNITEINHNFNSALVQRVATRRIMLHHSDSQGDEDAATIHRWHLSRGWAGIGYHFVVMGSGEIQRGRPENTVGAHAESNNSDSIGICLVGNFSRWEPSLAQLDSLVWLIKYLESKYGKLKIQSHRDVNPTECPGSKFPWERLQILLGNAPKPDPHVVKLMLNGRLLEVEEPLRVVDGRAQAFLSGNWVQLRDVANLLNADIHWDQVTRTVNIVIN